jgi:succinate-semialdehyde dehydrogenase/glutarate-semialdehyde dehydrogenase
MSRKIPENKQDARKFIISVNPATMEELGRVNLMGPDDVEKAINSAVESFPNWSQKSIEERGKYLIRARDYMLDHIDEIASLISREQGKPRVEAVNAEILLVSDLITYYTGRAKEILAEKAIPMHLFKFIKESKIVYQPLGVVTIISPWNYPFSIPMSGIMFALLAGNTVLFKPSSEVPLIGEKINEIITAGGALPRGVFNIVMATGASVGTKLYEPPVKKVVFTGSTEIGRLINCACAKNFIPAVMELGGKDPMIVLEDADIETAANGAVWGAFTNCGQVCASVERCYVHRSVYDRFVDKVAEKVRQLRVGQDLDFSVEMGPMINEEQLKIVEDQVLDALKKGAKVLAGGKRGNEKGYFHEPTVLIDVDHSMKVMKEETFGPLLPIMPFDTDDEAVNLANDTVYGLTASVWGKCRKRCERIAKRIQAGTVSVNDHGMSYGLCETPWQGMKESGLGRSHSDAGFLEFVYPQHIHFDNSPSFAKKRMWWFPYSQEAFDVLKMAAGAFARKSELPSFIANLLFKGKYRKAIF